MSENRVVLSGGDVFLTPEDLRSENWRLAMRLFLRELRSLKIESVEKVFKHWSVMEIEIGDTVRLGIEFPLDVERYQWFKTEGYELKKIQALQATKECYESKKRKA